MTGVSHKEFQSRFSGLTDRLSSTAALWKPRPFVDLPVSWETEYTGISASLRGLSVAQVERIRSDLSLVREVSPALRDLFDGNAQLTRWPDLSGEEELIDPKRNPLRVSGRKWQQVERFVSLVAPRSAGDVESWLDWCSGKGHLGRALSQVTGLTTVFVEKDEALCGPGFVNADVLTDNLGQLFKRGVGVVALHACGNLNAALLANAVDSDCGFLAISPCCYQRIVGQEYQPLSRAGRDSGLALRSHHLRLVSFEEVVVGRGQKARRLRDHAFRLGFDLLAREVTGADRYRPLGQLPSDFWTGSFERFASRVAEREKISLPAGWDASFYEKAGRERWETNRALSLVRSLFARCLESWLLLDRVLFLAENGWDVTAGEFCGRRLTPRNLIIIARK
jgi:hypothetical protein